MRLSEYVDSEKRAVANNIKKTAFVTKITVCALAGLFILLTVFLIIDIFSMTVKYTLEAGDSLPSAYVLTGRNDAQYDFGDDGGEFNVPGEYEIYIESGRRRFKLKLTVVDTTAPRAQILKLNVNQNGPYPEAIDFFEDIVDVSSVTAKFKNTVDPSVLGTYEIELELVDAYGNKRSGRTEMNVIVDKTPPTIKLAEGKSVLGYLGEAIAYKKAVEVEDNCFGEVDITVDTSAVNPDKVGTYKIKYTATDKAGNSSVLETTVTISENKVSLDDLMKKIGELANTLGITKNMSKEQQVKLIYGYVNDPTQSNGDNANIKFTDVSHTGHTDWIREAYLTLQQGDGDCFSYFAVSKAFFEYFGIESRDIERSAGVRNDGTHFWQMVNIGTADNPNWYYYDATRLKTPHDSGNACLFTQAQLDAYNNKNKDFLRFDRTGYPTASTKTINTNYKW